MGDLGTGEGPSGGLGKPGMALPTQALACAPATVGALRVPLPPFSSPPFFQLRKQKILPSPHRVGQGSAGGMVWGSQKLLEQDAVSSNVL